MRRKLRRPSPALVVACISLAVALSGTSYAALVLPKASVGTVHLKKNAVTSAKVKNASLLLADFAPAERLKLKGDPGAPGSKGDNGDKGDKGDEGDTGPQGVSGLSELEIVSQQSAASSTPSKLVLATCPSGKSLVTGAFATSVNVPAVAIFASHPNQSNNPTGWIAGAREVTPTTADWSVIAYAVCARAG